MIFCLAVFDKIEIDENTTLKERVWDWREILFNPTNRYYKAGTYSTLGVLTILANWQLGVTAGINQGA